MKGILDTWGYTLADKEKVAFVEFKDGSVVVTAPLAKKDNTSLTKYFITWGPISYKDITNTADPTNLAQIKTSEEYASANNGKEVYEVLNNQLKMMLPIVDSSKDIYITIEPQDANSTPGVTIEDYKLNASVYKNASSEVQADNYSNSSSDKAVPSVSCVWSKNDNEVLLTWTVNTAMSEAVEVEIYNKPNEDQGEMDLKDTVDIDDKEVLVETKHREIQLFRLKPIGEDGKMVGTEIHYICKPDDTEVAGANDKNDSTNNPSIPVTPHTGPKETIAFIAFVSLLAYVIYRKAKS